MERRYSTRSNAHRAAKAACRKALKAPGYQAYEGPDYEIHPDSSWMFDPSITHYRQMHDRYYFRLRGPALEATEQ